ncbi:ABC transporter permease [Angustibacter sp. Root456]|uniref:ABC transporter permease n=1 Tax=Angustibacter sp. Root456 TaxID=1736539 RepID=UPI000A5431AA|nr:ABC transporter permease [Angustibacter sp. Root456]
MSDQLSSRHVIGLVVRRELTARVRSKMFAISTALFLLSVVGLAVVMHFVGDRATTAKVGLLPSATAVAAPLHDVGTAVGLTVRTVQVPDEATAEQRLRDGSLDAVVVQAGAVMQVQVRRTLGDQLKAALTVLARQVAQDQAVAAAGGDAAQVRAAVARSAVQVRSVEPATQFQSERIALGLVAGILVYLSLMIYGQTVAQGVIEEKTSRVVELLLATLRPWQLMLGKVIGIGAAGLLQMVVVAGGGLAVGLALGTLTLPSSVAIGVVVWALVWYLIGFVMYALLFAAAGAMVSRQEDAGGVTAPILGIIIVPYVIAVSILPSQPDSKLAHVLSLVPVFSPTLMPVRIALGVVPTWELAFTVALGLAVTVGFVWITGRVYGNSVMRTGARVRLGDALKPL